MNGVTASGNHTGLFDDAGCPIYVGDVLYNTFAKYHVTVQPDTGEGFYGKLACDKQHPCSSIPYHLNNGKDHIHCVSQHKR